MIALLVLLLAQPAGPEKFEEGLRDAQRRYDIAAAAALVEAQRADVAATTEPARRELYVRGLLLLAELQRIEFEALPPENRSARRALGDKIDAVAEEGLTELDGLPETSETQRLRADFYGVMIRTDYQAKKYKNLMDAALARALELDPDNLHARLTEVKPFVFADRSQGGDPVKAIEMLDAILTRDAENEQALLLRGLAHEQAGHTAAAIEDWRHALRNNPECRPARDALAKYGEAGTSGKARQ